MIKKVKLGYLVGSNVATIIETNVYVKNHDIPAMEPDRALEIIDNKDSTGLTRDEKISFINYIRENNDTVAENWTTAQMLREFEYHESFYNTLTFFGVEADEEGEGIDYTAFRLRYVDFEPEQTTETYLRRFIGNAWPWPTGGE